MNGVSEDSGTYMSISSNEKQPLDFSNFLVDENSIVL